MAKRVQRIGNTTANTALFVGLAREITVDTDLVELCVHTGAGANTHKRIPNKDTNDGLYAAKTTLLTNLAALATAGGFVAKTAAATVAARTLTGTANQIVITNGDGVSGNPTFAFSSTVTIAGLTTMQLGAVVSGGGITQTGGNNSFVTTQITGLTATLAGQLTATGCVVLGAKFQQSNEIVNAFGNFTGNTVLNIASGNMITGTVTAACTVSFSGLTTTGIGTSFAIQLTNGGAFGIMWPTGTKWPGGAAPTLQSSGTDLIVGYTIDAGTTLRLSLAQGNSS